MINKLKKQFIVWHMSINTILILVCFLVIYLTTVSGIQNRNSERLNAIHADATSQIVSSEKSLMSMADYMVYFSIALDKNNTVTDVRSPVDVQAATINEALDLYLKNNGNEKDTLSFAGKRWMYSTTAYIEHLGAADQPPTRKIVFLDVTESYDVLNNLFIILLVVGLSVMILNYFISVAFASRVVRPIAASFEKQKRFVADASHELKTPLAIMTANVEALIATNASQEADHWIHNILKQIERMETLVKDLLFLAREEEKPATKELVPVNVSHIVEEALTEMEVTIFEKNIALQTEIQPGVMVRSNAFDIKQVMVILLDNAIKYTEEHGKITVRLEKTKHSTSVVIQNTCAGISKQHLQHIFDRFYRVNDARSHDGSFGLGLPIAKAIANKIGGSITVESKENESVSFSVVFKNDKNIQ